MGANTSLRAACPLRDSSWVKGAAGLGASSAEKSIVESTLIQKLERRRTAAILTAIAAKRKRAFAKKIIARAAARATA